MGLIGITDYSVFGVILVVRAINATVFYENVNTKLQFLIISFLAMRAHWDTMAHATVRTIEIERLPDQAEHGLIPKGRTISAAARTILLLKNATSCYIA